MVQWSVPASSPGVWLFKDNDTPCRGTLLLFCKNSLYWGELIALLLVARNQFNILKWSCQFVLLWREAFTDMSNKWLAWEGQCTYFCFRFSGFFKNIHIKNYSQINYSFLTGCDAPFKSMRVLLLTSNTNRILSIVSRKDTNILRVNSLGLEGIQLFIPQVFLQKNLVSIGV